MNESKNEILATRLGCLGGSDAKLIQGIAIANKIPQSAMKRLAVCKGLIEHQQFSNHAIEFGNYVEDMVFSLLHENDARWESNPCLLSEKYSRKNVKCIDHIDFYLQDDKKKEIIIAECKATRATYAQTYDEYKWQIMHHYKLGCEKARKLGGYKVKIMLCHYCTIEQNIEQVFEFEPSRLTVKVLRNLERLSQAYLLSEGMDIINDYLETFDVYALEDEIPYGLLPTKVKTKFDEMTALLAEIKEKEKKIEDFKKELFDFFTEKNIKSIKNEQWSITRVDPTESKQFDSKRYLEDFASKHPRAYKNAVKKFEKIVKRKGSVQIRIKNKQD